MATITGTCGSVRLRGSSIASTISSWSIDNTMEIQSYAASNTGGMRAKLPGLRSASGTFSGLGGIAPVLPGQEFIFEGFTGGMNSATGLMDPAATGKIYKCNALCTSVSINLNYGSFEPINWEVQWQIQVHDITTDILVISSGNIQDKSASTATVLSGDYTITFNDGTTTIPDVCISAATLTLSCESQQFSNSCTGGWQAAVPGAIDATLSVTVQDDSMILEPGESYIVTAYVDNTGTSYWKFTRLMCGSLSGLNVDISGGGVIEYSADLEFSAFTDGVKGSIIAPGGTTYWPTTSATP